MQGWIATDTELHEQEAQKHKKIKAYRSDL